MVEQLNPGMNVPAGVTNDALVATMISYLQQREADGSPRENDIITQLVASLASRMSPEAGAKVTAILARVAGVADAADALPHEDVVVPAVLAEDAVIAPDAMQESFSEQVIVLEPVPQLELLAATTEHEAQPLEPVADQIAASGELDEWAAALDAVEQQEPLTDVVIATVQVQDEPSTDPASEMPSANIQFDDDSTLDVAFAAPASPVMTSVMVQASGAAITPELANAIIAGGAMPAILAVVANPSATLTRSSLTTLSELAVSDLSLKQALCSRADLPEVIVDRLWPFLSPSSRASLLRAGVTISSDAAAAMRDDINVENRERIAAGDEVLTVAQALLDVNEQNWSLGDAVKALAGAGGVAEIGLLLAQVAGVDETAALALFLGNYDRGTVMLARAAGADEGAFEAILAVRGRSGARRTSDRRSPMFAFQATGINEARDVIARIAIKPEQAQTASAPPAVIEALAA